jgi:hypothetical protein
VSLDEQQKIWFQDVGTMVPREKKVADDGKKWLASNNTLDNLKDKK